jgi:superfamily II DNA or RNA helicase
MNRWPHQIRGVKEVLDLVYQDKRRICLTSPTGGGKTLIVSDLLDWAMQQNYRAVVYSNRKMMVDQLSAALHAAGLEHGVRSPDHDDERHLPLQISSIQTEIVRSKKRTDWKLHDAHFVFVDEAHIQTGPEASKILEAHHEAGAALVGVTATPLDLEGLYEDLVIAGTASELRKCGALVLAYHYGCDEPDFRVFKKLRETAETVSEAASRQAIVRPGLFARVLDWFEKLNPDHKPTILFAPGVRESIYFAEQFTLAGITAAHIDGQDVWAHGRLYESNAEVRASVLKASREGRCPVICNRFVLREGINAPWLGHCILATVFGSLSSYLQSVGRLLRASPGLSTVAIQDHGGNWWRHGSPNCDRQWYIGATAKAMNGMRTDAERSGKAPQPSRCPACGAIQVWKSPVCQFCGHERKARVKISRPVVQMDGTLKEMTGDVWRPRRVCTRHDGPAIWKRMYFRSLQPKANGRTFRAAMALYAQENDWGWPARDWPFMPVSDYDLFLSVRDVPREMLIQE